MEQLFANLWALIAGIACLILTIALIHAFFRMDQTTRAMLFELQKVSAALLLANDLVEGPKVKGRPRIVWAGEHQRSGAS